MREGKRGTLDTSSRDEGEISEEEIDVNLEETFPASDPPSWTLGTDHREESPAGSSAGESQRETLSQAAEGSIESDDDQR
jgi:hypothetical protein